MTKTSKKSLLLTLSIVLVVAFAISLTLGMFTAFAGEDYYAAYDTVMAAIKPAGASVKYEEMEAMEIDADVRAALEVLVETDYHLFTRAPEDSDNVYFINLYVGNFVKKAMAIDAIAEIADANEDGIVSTEEFKSVMTHENFPTWKDAVWSYGYSDVIKGKVLTEKQATSLTNCVALRSEARQALEAVMNFAGIPEYKSVRPDNLYENNADVWAGAQQDVRFICCLGWDDFSGYDLDAPDAASNIIDCYKNPIAILGAIEKLTEIADADKDGIVSEKEIEEAPEDVSALLATIRTYKGIRTYDRFIPTILTSKQQSTYNNAQLPLVRAVMTVVSIGDVGAEVNGILSDAELKAMPTTDALAEAIVTICAASAGDITACATNGPEDFATNASAIKTMYSGAIAHRAKLAALIALADDNGDGKLVDSEISLKTSVAFRNAVKDVCAKLSDADAAAFKQVLTADEKASYDAVVTMYGPSVEIIEVNNKYTAEEVAKILPTVTSDKFDAIVKLAAYDKLADNCKKFVDSETKKVENLLAAKAKFEELAASQKAVYDAFAAIMVADNDGKIVALDIDEWQVCNQTVVLDSYTSYIAAKQAMNEFLTLVKTQTLPEAVKTDDDIATLLLPVEIKGVGTVTLSQIYAFMDGELEVATITPDALAAQALKFATDTSNGADAWKQVEAFKAFETTWMNYFFPNGMFGPSNASGMNYFLTYKQEAFDAYNTVFEAVHELDDALNNAIDALKAIKVMENGVMINIDPWCFYTGTQQAALASADSVAAAEAAVKAYKISFTGQTLNAGETIDNLLVVDGVDYLKLLEDVKSGMTAQKDKISAIMMKINLLYLDTNYGVDVWDKQAEIKELRERIEGTFVSGEDDMYPTLAILSTVADNNLSAMAKATIPGTNPVEYAYPYYAFLCAMESRVEEIKGMQTAAKEAIAAIKVWDGADYAVVDGTKLAAKPAEQEVVLSSMHGAAGDDASGSIAFAKAAIDTFVAAGGSTSEIENYALYEAVMTGYNAQIAKIDALMQDIKTVFESTKDLTVVLAHSEEILNLDSALKGTYEGSDFTNLPKDTHNDISKYAQTTPTYAKYIELLNLMLKRLTAIDAKIDEFEAAVNSVMVFDRDNAKIGKYSEDNDGEIVLASKTSLDVATAALEKVIKDLASEMTRAQVITYLDITTNNESYDAYVQMLADYDALNAKVSAVTGQIDTLYATYKEKGALYLIWDLESSSIVAATGISDIETEIGKLDDETIVDQTPVAVNDLKALVVGSASYAKLTEMKDAQAATEKLLKDTTHALKKAGIMLYSTKDKDMVPATVNEKDELGSTMLAVVDTMPTMATADGVIEGLKTNLSGMTLPTFIGGEYAKLLGDMGQLYLDIKEDIEDLKKEIENNFEVIDVFAAYSSTTGGYVYKISEQVADFYECVFDNTNTTTTKSILVSGETYNLTKLDDATVKGGHNDLVKYAQVTEPFKAQYEEFTSIKNAVDEVLALRKAAEDAISAIQVWNSTSEAMEAYGAIPLAADQKVVMESLTSIEAAEAAIKTFVTYLVEEQWGTADAERNAEIKNYPDYEALKLLYEDYETNLLKVMYAVYLVSTGAEPAVPADEEAIASMELPADYEGKTSAEIKTAIETLLKAIDLSSYNGDLTLTSNDNPNVYSINIDLVDEWHTYFSEGSFATFAENATYMSEAKKAIDAIYEAAHAAVTLVQTAIDDIVKNEAEINKTNVDDYRDYLIATKDAYDDLSETQQALIKDYDKFYEIYSRIEVANYLEIAIANLIINTGFEVTGSTLDYTDEQAVTINEIKTIYNMLPANTQIFVRNYDKFLKLAEDYEKTKPEEIITLGALKEQLTTLENKLQSKIDAINAVIGKFDFEDYDTVTEAITALLGMVDNIEADIATIKGDIASVQGEITKLQGKDTELEGMIKALETKLGTTEGSLQSMIESKINEVKGVIGDFNFAQYETITEAVSDFLKRISANETAIAKLNADVDALETKLEGKIAAINALIGEFKFDDYNTVTEAVTALLGMIDSIEADIATIEGDITTINGKITALEGKDVELEGKITEVDTKLDAAKGALETMISTKINEVYALIGEFKFDDYPTITAAVQGLLGLIDSAEAEIATIQQSIETLETAITALQGKDEELAGQIAAIKAELESNKAALEAKIAEIEEEIADIKVELTASVANLQAQITALTGELATKVAELEAADAANKAELLANIAAVKAELQTTIAELETAYKAADAELQQSINDLSADLESQVNALKAVDAANKAALEAAIASAKSELEAADAANKAETDAKIANLTDKHNAELEEFYKTMNTTTIVLGSVCGALAVCVVLLFILKKRS